MSARATTWGRAVEDAARAGAGGAIAALAAWQGYRRTLGRRHDRWGASDEEVAMPLPGDGLVPDPAAQNTRAIGIAATPGQVWPWLVQMGADRAGFYTYTWLENLAGLGIRNADRIVERWQRLAVGDVVRADAHADATWAGGWYVAELVPEKALVLQMADLERGEPMRREGRGAFEFLWTFALLEQGDGTTRLVVRERVAFGNRAVQAAMAPFSLVSYVLTRGTLLGIKQRAEAAAAQSLSSSRPALPSVAFASSVSS
jgi:hypothetical protein